MNCKNVQNNYVEWQKCEQKQKHNRSGSIYLKQIISIRYTLISKWISIEQIWNKTWKKTRVDWVTKPRQFVWTKYLAAIVSSMQDENNKLCIFFALLSSVMVVLCQLPLAHCFLIHFHYFLIGQRARERERDRRLEIKKRDVAFLECGFATIVKMNLD